MLFKKSKLAAAFGFLVLIYAIDAEATDYTTPQYQTQSLRAENWRGKLLKARLGGNRSVDDETVKDKVSLKDSLWKVVPQMLHDFGTSTGWFSEDKREPYGYIKFDKGLMSYYSDAEKRYIILANCLTKRLHDSRPYTAEEIARILNLRYSTTIFTEELARQAQEYIDYGLMAKDDGNKVGISKIDGNNITTTFSMNITDDDEGEEIYTWEYSKPKNTSITGEKSGGLKYNLTYKSRGASESKDKDKTEDEWTKEKGNMVSYNAYMEAEELWKGLLKEAENLLEKNKTMSKTEIVAVINKLCDGVYAAAAQSVNANMRGDSNKTLLYIIMELTRLKYVDETDMDNILKNLKYANADPNTTIEVTENGKKEKKGITKIPNLPQWALKKYNEIFFPTHRKKPTPKPTSQPSGNKPSIVGQKIAELKKSKISKQNEINSLQQHLNDIAKKGDNEFIDNPLNHGTMAWGSTIRATIQQEIDKTQKEIEQIDQKLKYYNPDLNTNTGKLQALMTAIIYEDYDSFGKNLANLNNKIDLNLTFDWITTDEQGNIASYVRLTTRGLMLAAAENKHYVMISELARAGLDIKNVDGYGGNLAHYYVNRYGKQNQQQQSQQQYQNKKLREYEDVFNYLKSQPIKVEDQNSERYADLNGKDDKGNTPLYLAAVIYKDPLLTQALINAGANIYVKNGDGLYLCDEEALTPKIKDIIKFKERALINEATRYNDINLLPAEFFEKHSLTKKDTSVDTLKQKLLPDNSQDFDIFGTSNT